MKTLFKPPTTPEHAGFGYSHFTIAKRPAMLVDLKDGTWDMSLTCSAPAVKGNQAEVEPALLRMLAADLRFAAETCEAMARHAETTDQPITSGQGAQP